MYSSHRNNQLNGDLSNTYILRTLVALITCPTRGNLAVVRRGRQEVGRYLIRVLSRYAAMVACPLVQPIETCSVWTRRGPQGTYPGT